MLRIAPCAGCQQSMLVDDALAHDRRLACPACQSEFTAGGLLSASVSLPPPAIELDASVEERRASESDFVQTTAAAEAIESETALSESINTIFPSSTADERIEPIVVECAPAGERTEELVGDAALPVAQDGSAARAEKTDDEISLSGLVFDGAASDASNTKSMAARSRRRSAGRGLLPQLLGVVLGGVVGLAIGYVILLWIGGERADFLELRGRWRDTVRYFESLVTGAGGSGQDLYSEDEATEFDVEFDEKPSDSGT